MQELARLGIKGLVASGLVLWAVACRHEPAELDSSPPGPERVAIVDPEYGAHPDYPDALSIGEQLDTLELPLADGGRFELARARAAGPVILVWIGAAEHESLITWLRGLDAALAKLDARGATLVFVRDLEPESALRWAIELSLQTVVAVDPEGVLASHLDLIAEPGDAVPALDFALVILDSAGVVRYRKLGARRPQLDELLHVLDGEAGELRCCPAACVGDPCERAPS